MLLGGDFPSVNKEMQNRRGRLLARSKSGYYFFSVGRCGFIRFFQKFYLYRLILLLKAIFYDKIFKLKVLSFRCGLMVKRLRRSPLKAESGVRFSVGLPKNTPDRECFCFTSTFGCIFRLLYRQNLRSNPVA